MNQACVPPVNVPPLKSVLNQTHELQKWNSVELLSEHIICLCIKQRNQMSQYWSRPLFNHPREKGDIPVWFTFSAADAAARWIICRGMLRFTDAIKKTSLLHKRFLSERRDRPQITTSFLCGPFLQRIREIGHNVKKTNKKKNRALITLF